jgi:hypothetical protein
MHLVVTAASVSFGVRFFCLDSEVEVLSDARLDFFDSVATTGFDDIVC